LAGREELEAFDTGEALGHERPREVEALRVIDQVLDAPGDALRGIEDALEVGGGAGDGDGGGALHGRGSFRLPSHLSNRRATTHTVEVLGTHRAPCRRGARIDRSICTVVTWPEAGAGGCGGWRAG